MEKAKDFNPFKITMNGPRCVVCHEKCPPFTGSHGVGYRRWDNVDAYRRDWERQHEASSEHKANADLYLGGKSILDKRLLSLAQDKAAGKLVWKQQAAAIEEAKAEIGREVTEFRAAHDAESRRRDFGYTDWTAVDTESRRSFGYADVAAGA